MASARATRSRSGVPLGVILAGIVLFQLAIGGAFLWIVLPALSGRR
jgi:hypothetical protein